MNVVGRVGSFITQGMYSVATPFHPFGGAVDIIVVKQQDGTFRSTPWYVRFGKFQGVLKGTEKVVRIEVNGVEANFNMYLDNSGEAYFLKEVDLGKDGDGGLKDPDKLESRKEEDSRDERNSENPLKENGLCGLDDNNYNYGEVDGRDERFNSVINRLERVESDCNTFYEFQDQHASLEGSLEFSQYGSSRYDTLHSVENALESQNSTSEVVLVSVDGHILTAPISSSERNSENVQLSTPQFHLGPGGGTEEYNRGGATWTSDYLSNLQAAEQKLHQESIGQSNSSFFSAEHQLGHSEGSRHAQEFRDSSKSACIDSSSESPSASSKKDEVFKSCLELQALALQPSKGSHGTIKADDSSPRDSEYSNTVSLPESLAGSAQQEIDTSDRDDHDSANAPAQSVSNNSAPEDQLNEDALVKSDPSNVDVLAFKDEYSTGERDKPHPEASMRGLELSLCGNLLHAGMGLLAAEDVFDANLISPEEFNLSAASIVNNENLIIRIQGKYLPWARAMHIILGRAAFGLNLPVEPHDVVPVDLDVPEVKEDSSAMTSTPRRRWRLWPIPFRRVQTLEHTNSNSSNEESFLDSESVSQSQSVVSSPTSIGACESPHKQILRTKVPTTDQVASLNLREGQNMVNFIFSTRVLGPQKVEAHIYLWKWNTRIVISDVDGTITKSDVLGQFMPLVGRDWTHSGIARLYSGIKENGYQLLFLSARAIVQAYLTKSFLFNLKQDGKSLPNGPVVISPDGLFPSLYREVIRRAPHEFKIACLEDIKALFPSDYNPFYAGFGNRDTDELSYRKIGIPKGKIFIINPKGEVAINHRIDVKSYTSLHTLVNDMFPPTSLVEQEDFNSWNYWKMPLPDLDNL